MKNFKKEFTHQNFIKKISGGFTLIELLVVVAIIGVLAAIVLVSLGSARGKGKDAAVKSNLTNAMKQAEIFYNLNTTASNTYSSVCTNGVVGGTQGVGAMVLAAAKAVGLSSYAPATVSVTSGAAGSATTATCNNSPSAWAAEVPLVTGTNQMWCVDSTGKSQQETGTSLANATDYTCN